MNNKLMVNGAEISVTTIEDKDYISLTDMLKAKDGDFFISDWLRNRNTVEFLGIWEQIHNPNFNYGEFAIIRSQAGLNSYKLSVKEWVEKTNAIGLKARAGRYGGTYAYKDIAFEFGMWISPEFKIYLIRVRTSQGTGAAASRMGHQTQPCKNQLPYLYGRDQRKPDSAGAVGTANVAGICQRSRCAEYGTVRQDCKAVAR